MSELGKRIGQRIRELRTQRPERWTQEELAERARISVSFLSMIERGERVAHVETLAALQRPGRQPGRALRRNGADTAQTEDLLRPLSDFARARGLTPGTWTGCWAWRAPCSAAPPPEPAALAGTRKALDLDCP